MSNLYDCAIIGSGIAGTTNALVLAQMGLKVIVLEAKTHPRFAIGEAMTPTNTQCFEYLSEKYDVPALKNIIRYPLMRKTGLGGWPKLGFWFGHHEDGVPLPPGKELAFSSPRTALGADVHILRSDVDHYLVKQLEDYNVEYWDNTKVLEFDFRSDKVVLQLERLNNREKVEAKFLLDCSGHNSPVAKLFDLRDSPTKLMTNARSVFSHFRDVVLLDNVLNYPSRQGIRRDLNTVHHCFDGGWFWLIRFDNHVTSIGVMLDREIYPDNDLAAEEEFDSVVQRFPTVAEQYRFIKPIRNYTKTGRIQYSSHTLAGDRYLLTPHAAAFIDPLFSTGLGLTAAFTIRAAPVIQQMVEKNDFHADYMRPLERSFLEELTLTDKLVHGIYKSFRNSEIFKQFWRCWIYMSALQYHTFEEWRQNDVTPPLPHFGATLPSWQAQFERMYCRVLEQAEHEHDEAVAAELKAMMDAYPEPFHKKDSNWEINSPEGCHPVDVSANWFPRMVAEEPVLRAALSPSASTGGILA